MITFIFGILILIFGYIFYSRYTEKQFGADNRITPASALNDGVDFIPLDKNRNMLIHLLNIAGLGPILGAVQGILFGPIAFILIPLGAVFMGSVHDYFAGMLSIRNNGAQITEIIRKYLGSGFYKFFTIAASLMLLIVASVFVFTAGDIAAERFFSQTDFSISNPVIISIYAVIALYYILAAMLPIDKIIGRFYPLFGLLLLIGTGLIFTGFFIHGVNLENIDFSNINRHPLKQHILPMFFMTVSCGLLSGFHSTQTSIIARTLNTEKEGRRVFFGMMCVESLIAMIWAAAAMHVYSLHLIPEKLIGTANVINAAANVFVHPYLAFIVTAAAVILPVTTGDTALRGLRMIIAETLKLPQRAVKNRLLIMLPSALLVTGIVFWAKIHNDSFSIVWRYFNFVNQLIAVPALLCASVYLFKNNKNWLMTFIPAVFYIFITICFLLTSPIGFNINYKTAVILAAAAALISAVMLYKYKIKN